MIITWRKGKLPPRGNDGNVDHGTCDGGGHSLMAPPWGSMAMWEGAKPMAPPLGINGNARKKDVVASVNVYNQTMSRCGQMLDNYVGRRQSGDAHTSLLSPITLRGGGSWATLSLAPAPSLPLLLPTLLLQFSPPHRTVDVFPNSIWCHLWQWVVVDILRINE